jgi:hypothetical protein
MKHVTALFGLLLPLLPAAGYAQSSQYGTYAEAQTLLRGVDLDALNAHSIITCVRYGVAQQAGQPDLADPVAVVATTAVYQRLHAETQTLNQTDQAHVWSVRCQPNMVIMTPGIVRRLGGQRAAESAIWQPPVTSKAAALPSSIWVRTDAGNRRSISDATSIAAVYGGRTVQFANGEQVVAILE